MITIEILKVLGSLATFLTYFVLVISIVIELMGFIYFGISS